MKVKVFLKGPFSEQDIEIGRKRYQKHGLSFKIAEYELEDFDSDNLGDGKIYFDCERGVDVERQTSILVKIFMDVNELLENEKFWTAIRDCVEKVEKEQRRFHLMKALLKTREELRGENK